MGSHAYFTSTSYDSRGRLILSAEFDGRVQLCRVDLQRWTLHVLTDLACMRASTYCVAPATDVGVVIDGSDLVQVDLESGQARGIFAAPDGWRIHLPTIDAKGARIAFALSERIPGMTASDRIYSTMEENFFFRPRSMVCTIDLDDGKLTTIWGEAEWISHVLINPADPDTVVFCHEGGGLVQQRLWVVDARKTRKKAARMLYREAFEEFLVHEYFVSDGTLGVQRTVYPEEEAQFSQPVAHCNSVMFLDMDGSILADYRLPGRRSGHVQSNSDNSAIVADAFYPSPDTDPAEGRKYLALNIPDGSELAVEKLCFHGTSGKTQLSHGHPLFSPDDKHVVFSSDYGGTNSAFVVEV